MRNILIFIFLPLNVYGATNFCDVVQASKTIKTFEVPENVNFFIRGAPATGEVGFATNAGNTLLDSKTGIKTKAPGNIDPILTPDGKILSVPQSMLFDPKTQTYSQKPYNFTGAEIYQGSVRNCVAGKCDPTNRKASEVESSQTPYVAQVMTFYSRDSLDKPIFIDKNVKYSYQSFGQLRKDGAVNSYRLLFESQDGIQARDYRYDETSKSFAPVGPVKSLCNGLVGFVPAQSKSGDEYSAYDAEKGVTHVFSIGKSGVDCKIKETFPGLLGKIDFSPDGKRLAYHIDKKMDNNRSKNIVLAANEKNSMESVVFDRETKRAAIVAKSSRSNSYYPVFLDDSTIAFIDSSKGESPQQNPQFTIKLASLERILTPECPHCRVEGSREEQASAFIGAIRDKACEKDPEFYFKNGVSSFSSLTVAQCQSVVESCDSKCLSDIKQQIAQLSAGGETKNKGVSKYTVQKWKIEIMSKLEKKDLSAFCTEFVNANAAVTNKTSPSKVSY